MARAVAAWAVLWLAGCGGGGGGAVDEAPDPGGGGGGGGAGSAVTPLAFTTGNVGYAAGFALYAGDLAARTALVAIDATRQQAGLENRPCFPGSRQSTWTDADRDGRLSAGDSIDVAFTECGGFAPHILLNGSMRIHLLSVAGERLDGLTAEVRLGSAGFHVGGNIPSGEPTVGGSFLVGWQRQETQVQLTVSPTAADDFRREFRRGGAPTRDHWRGIQLVKRVRHDLARSEVTLAMRYESGELGGSFEVATPTALYGRLSVYPAAAPDQGRLTLRGAGGDTAAVTVGTDAVYPIVLDFDDGGDGRSDGTGRGRWADIGDGHLWQDTSLWTTPTVVPEQSIFRLEHGFAASPTVATDATLRLQFTRLPAESTALQIRLLDMGRIYDLSYGPGVEHPIVVERIGALVLIRLQEPMRYSRRYRLEVATDADGNKTVHDVDGQSLSIGNGVLGGLQTPDELRPVVQRVSAQAVAEPARTVVLSCEGSVTGGTPPAAVAWTQLDGPPLVFDAPAALRTGVRLAAGTPTPPAYARVRLTLTHRDGAQETTDFTLKVADGTLPPGGRGYRLSGPAADGSGYAEIGTTATGEDATGPGFPDGTLYYSYAEYTTTQPRNFVLTLVPASGTTLQPGTTTDAVRADAVIAATDRLQVGLLQAGLACQATGPVRVVIHELERDAAAVPIRLAVDVEAACAGSGVPLRASVRIGSSWPLP